MRIIRLNEVINRTGLGKTSLYKFIKAKTFPQPIALGERAVGWVEAEVDQWITARVNERDLSKINTFPE
ncbi:MULTISPECIES: AlpA family transcriptional regulator [Comamonas]|jgi:prophage regulatory protein|uniref:AlpA family transcriptional regulator n=2 Tax=Comamonas TaxID=283 RepID=A0AA42HX97_9BURK|nr:MULTISPECIES: AlpA family transcriptional regulator [Comamonas]MDH0201133.1 AlpA family transcriptional regulator [Comamonas aquatica]MDH0363367.1 AlpA family transcriptional regulator [Comamonas aquatica]MDH0371453.1 AlpA family transcriptional regulator [Comamonas aquatica]MDH0496310.1 AlpA family transcriptional regulator [Comamonas aquatica]MDH1428926.1 AlpA family transcriptional regulator [Comamonas aquatica]